MADICAHCASSNVAALFETFECLDCGCHTDAQGAKTLPSSLLIPPNHPESLVAYGATTLPDRLVNGPDVQHPFVEFGNPFEPQPADAVVVADAAAPAPGEASYDEHQIEEAPC